MQIHGTLVTAKAFRTLAACPGESGEIQDRIVLSPKSAVLLKVQNDAPFDRASFNARGSAVVNDLAASFESTISVAEPV